MKTLYAIFLDGDILPDTHIFAFKNLGSAILSLLLFSRTVLNKELRLYSVGTIENGFIKSNERVFICDFYSADNVLSSFLQAGNDSPLSMEYLRELKNTIESEIVQQYLPAEHEVLVPVDTVDNDIK